MTVSTRARLLAYPLSILAALAAIVGRARVVALTEPFHLAHEPLDARNRIIRHLVTQQGFTAVALETGLAQSRILYEYVLGRAPDNRFGHPRGLHLRLWSLQGFMKGELKAFPPDPLAPLLNGLQRAGNFAHAILGADLVTIGTYFGQFTGPDAGPISRKPDGAGPEALFGSFGMPAYLADLREISATGPLHEFLARSHETRIDLGTHRLAPFAGYDAIVYIERITPSVVKR